MAHANYKIKNNIFRKHATYRRFFLLLKRLLYDARMSFKSHNTLRGAAMSMAKTNELNQEFPSLASQARRIIANKKMAYVSKI